MTTLRALQAAMHGVLRGETPVDEAAGRLGVDPRRLAVYRDFVRGHVRTALEKNFRVTRALLPTETWEALCAAYFRDLPPAHWELNAAAESFPAWLEQRLDDGHAGLEPFHVDLAQFEWEEFAAYVHPAEVEPPGPGEPPRPNPTLSLVAFGHPVAAFVRAWYAGERAAGDPLPGPLDAPQPTAFFRHPRTGKVMYQVADDDLLFALKVTHDGLDPAAAARSIGQPGELGERAVARAIELGLVLAPT